MGLPRYLADKYTVSRSSSEIWEIFARCFSAGANAGERAFDISQKFDKNKRILNQAHVISCFLKWHWKSLEFRKYKSYSQDGLTRCTAKLYVGLLASGGPDLRQVSVPKYFLGALERLNERRQNFDELQIQKLAEIRSLQKKVYSSRIFPARLRAIIFERDNHTCQNCLRDRETLAKAGRHLEVDHIVPWIDGGLTTYSNGRTLCSECNIGRHHAKEFLAALAVLSKK